MVDVLGSHDGEERRTTEQKKNERERENEINKPNKIKITKTLFEGKWD